MSLDISINTTLNNVSNIDTTTATSDEQISASANKKSRSKSSSSTSYNLKDESKYSIGKTDSNELFKVPVTNDMVQQLFDPNLKKSHFDYLIVLTLLSNCFIYYFLPENYKIITFIGFYLFWRLCYNVGIGILLYYQSKYQSLFKITNNLLSSINNNNEKPKSLLQNLKKILINNELEIKIDDLNYNSLPLEFKTWILFRVIVNLILMNDFTTYILLVLACSKNSFDQSLPLIILRWSLGIGLFIFNLIVKLDAHKIVKDYAWYWGDFFFRLHNNEELIFDGVFDLAPHPMYSIGYAGYYGFALMTKSYTVLMISIIGHILQILFLNIVETPHIEKLYGSSDDSNSFKFIKKRDLNIFRDEGSPSLIFFYKNFNFIRITDYFQISILIFFGFILPFLLPYDLKNNKILIITTILIKILSSFLIDSILYFQSKFKSFTKYQMKNSYLNLNNLENIKRIEILTFKNFTIIYNSILILNYSNLICISIREIFFNFNEFISKTKNNYLFLKLIISISLIILQLSINLQIIDSIGIFGWFYGDFFLILNDSKKKFIKNLTRSGIYRYLNNPERFSSILTIWSLFLIFNYKIEFLILSIIYTLNNYLILNFIEKPHMIELYGENNVINHKSGIEKSLNQLFLPLQLQDSIIKISTSVDNLINNSSKIVDNYIVNKRRKSSSNKNLHELNKQKLALKLIKENHQSINSNAIDENIEEITDSEISSISGANDLTSPIIELLNKKYDPITDTYYFYIGEPIEIKWNCKITTETSWIGFYNLLQTSRSKLQTLISSLDHWLPIHKSCKLYKNKLINYSDLIVDNDNDGNEDNTGKIIFQNDLLYFKPGAYEFRFYLNSNHEVYSISEAFELRLPILNIPKISNDSQIIQDEIIDKFVDEVYLKIFKPIYDNISLIDLNSNWISIISDKKNKLKFENLSNLINLILKFNLNKNYLINEENLKKLCIKLIRIKNLFDSDELNDFNQFNKIENKKII